MEKIRFGIVGCGRVSPKHLNAIMVNPEAELIATCDIIETKAKEAAQEYRAKRHYSDYCKMLKDPEVDVISICTPSGLHAEMALQACNAGKDVIVEKPMALNVGDAEKMITEFSNKKKKLCVIKQNRFNKPIRLVREKLLGGNVGKIMFIKGTARWYRPQEYYDDSWHGSKDMDGGVLMNQGIHYIDLLLYFMDKPVKSIFCHSTLVGHKIECDDLAVVTVKFEDGSIGVVEISTIAYPRNFEGSMTLLCEKGVIKIGGTSLNKIETWSLDEDLPEESAKESHQDIYGNGHYYLISNYLNHKIRGEKLLVDGEEGFKSLRLVEVAYRSAKSGKEEVLE